MGKRGLNLLEWAKENNPDLIVQWVDSRLMSEFKPYDREKVEWYCEKHDYHWSAAINSRTYSKKGCKKCKAESGWTKRAESSKTPKLSELSIFPSLKWCYEKNDLLGLIPEKFTKGSSKSVWWRCQFCDTPFSMMIKFRVNRLSSRW